MISKASARPRRSDRTRKFKQDWKRLQRSGRSLRATSAKIVTAHHALHCVMHSWQFVEKRPVTPAKAGVQKTRIKRINMLLDAGFLRHDGNVVTKAIFNKLLRVHNTMKRVMRCHDFRLWRDKATGEKSCQPEGLRPQSRARRSAEQGPRLRGCDRVGVQRSRG